MLHDKDSRGALAYLALAGEMIRRDEDGPSAGEQDGQKAGDDEGSMTGEDQPIP